MLFEQVSTRRRQCTFWTQGRLQGCKARLSVGLEGLLGGTHRQHPEGWGCFPGTWASLLPEAPCQAEDAWSGGSGGWGGRGLPRLRGSDWLWEGLVFLPRQELGPTRRRLGIGSWAFSSP